MGMCFQKLPKFTSEGNYRVNTRWDYFCQWIEERIEEDDLQLCPDFQRGHVWTEEQQIKYIEFILRGGTSGKVIRFNQPGWGSSYLGEFVCVDGLQRITAVRRFMNNEIPAFGCLYKDFEGWLPHECEFELHVNNLKTRKEVLKWYIELNTGGTQHTDDEIDRVKLLLRKELTKDENSGQE